MRELRTEIVISAPPAAVYTCWTFANMLSHWLCNRAMLRASPGQAYTLIWDGGNWAAGVFTAAEQDNRLAFSWQEAHSPGTTQIEVNFALEASGTRLTLTQTGFGSGDAWETYYRDFERGWPEMLASLKTLMETANDARFLRRPLVGIDFERMNSERRESLKLPVNHGVRLTAVAPGGAAHKAGLRVGDVMLTINGVEISGFEDFNLAIAGKTGGDTVKVGYFRDGTSYADPLTFGSREPSYYPETRAELEELVSERVAAAERELDEIFAGIPEEVLAAKPAPAEWSANDVLAHLIWTERWTQQSLWLLHTAGIDPVWGFNNDFEIAGIAGVHPHSTDLLAELKRALNEQRLMIAKISDDVVAVKPLFALMSGWLSFIGDHLREHYDQIRDAITHAQAPVPESTL